MSIIDHVNIESWTPEEVILIATVVSRVHTCTGKEVSLRALAEKWPIFKWMEYLDFVLNTGIPETVTNGLKLYKAR